MILKNRPNYIYFIFYCNWTGEVIQSWPFAYFPEKVLNGYYRRCFYNMKKIAREIGPLNGALKGKVKSKIYFTQEQLSCEEQYKRFTA